MPRRTSSHPDHGADVIPLQEAACRLGIHPDTYKVGVRNGSLPGIHFGATYLVPRDWYMRFLVGDWTPAKGNEQEAA
jgi:hypothetical protein